MRALMRRIETLAETENARRVSVVSVRLGALSHMSAAHFHEHFDEVSAGSIAEGARLDIDVSDDIDDPDATEVVLRSVEVET